MKELHEQYTVKLRGELQSLSDLVSDVPSDFSKLLDTLHQRLHKLAGSAGTFGFAELSEKARQLEIQVKLWLDNPPANIPHEWETFAHEIGQLPSTLSPSQNGKEQDSPVNHSSTEELLAAPQHHQVRVYVVNGDARLAEEMAFTLRHFGHQTSWFTSLAQSTQAQADGRPHAMIIDTDLLQEEGTDPLMSLGTVPLIFTSHCQDFDTRIQVARAGGQGFFLHPVDIPKLVDRLSQLLRSNGDTPYRVLIVDDDRDLAQHFQLVLQGAGMEVQVLEEPSRILDAVKEQRPEIILMDLYMPGYSGVELARLLRLQDDWLHTPIVYVSGETDLKKQMSALGHAGDDFITKPLSDEQLIAAVKVRVSRARMLSELMSRDSLTGLFNHSRIKEQLVLEVSRAQRNDAPLSAVMLDMDKFKHVNDTYGHGVGDRVIKTLAHLLQQRVRQSDTVGRYGGEEFAAILPDCDAASAWSIVDDIRQRFGQVTFFSEGKEFHVTLSAGIASSTDYDNAEAMLMAADEALYLAKASGRNQVCLAGQKPEESS
nr:diguanylate cyclase [Desulfurispira natronophila]